MSVLVTDVETAVGGFGTELEEVRGALVITKKFKVSVRVLGQLIRLLDLTRRVRSDTIYGEWWPKLDKPKASNYWQDKSGALSLCDEISEEVQYFLEDLRELPKNAELCTDVIFSRILNMSRKLEICAAELLDK